MGMLVRDIISKVIYRLLCNTKPARLNQITEGEWLDSSNRSISTRSGKEISLTWGLGLSFQIHLLPALACCLLNRLVALDTCNNLLLTGALTNMFNTNMDTLLEDASIHQLVHTHAHGAFGNVENNASPAMVVLVWHTLVNGGVGEDVDVVAHLHGKEVLGEVRQSMLTEFLPEHGTRSRTPTEGMRHGSIVCGVLR